MMTRQTAAGLLLLSGLLLSPSQTLQSQAAEAHVNGVTLHYEVEGSGNPLVLIHGWAVPGGFWDGDMGRFTPHYTVIRYDRRGFGASSGKPDVTADPADLKALLETLGHRRATIMGHSQGAAVALTFAVRYPEMVDALILYGAGPPAGFGLPQDGVDAMPMAEWVEIGRTKGIDSLRAAITRTMAPLFHATPRIAGRSRALLQAYQGQDLIDPGPLSNLVQPAHISELRTVQAPTLVLVGEHEMPYFSIVADALTYGITGAKKTTLEGGGHIVSWTEPERFAAEILRFLREAEESPDGARP
jgi:pimeloyl-ACP methyl ester carboxylesterase